MQGSVVQLERRDQCRHSKVMADVNFRPRIQFDSLVLIRPLPRKRAAEHQQDQQEILERQPAQRRLPPWRRVALPLPIRRSDLPSSKEWHPISLHKLLIEIVAMGKLVETIAHTRRPSSKGSGCSVTPRD